MENDDRKGQEVSHGGGQEGVETEHETAEDKLTVCLPDLVSSSIVRWPTATELELAPVQSEQCSELVGDKSVDRRLSIATPAPVEPSQIHVPPDGKARVLAGVPKRSSPELAPIAQQVNFKCLSQSQGSCTTKQHEGTAPTDVTCTPVQQKRKPSVRFGAATFPEATERTASRPEQRMTIRAVTSGIFLALSACVVLLLFFVFWPNNTGSDIEPCISQLCRKALQYLDDASNPHVAPCDDFYEYVCYKWLKEENSSFLDDSVRDLYMTVSTTLLTQRSEEHDRYGMRTFRSLYEACYACMTDDGHPLLRDVMNAYEKEREIFQLGNSSELITWLLELSIALGIDSVFQIGFVTGDGRRFLFITSGQPLFQRFGERSMKDSFVTYMKHVVNEISHLIGSRLQVLKCVLYLDATLSEIEEDGGKGTVMLTLDDLGSLTPRLSTVDWIAKMNALLRDEPSVSSSDPLLTTGFKAIRNTLAALDSVTRDARLCYLYIQVMAGVLRFDYRRQYGAVQDVTETCLTACRNVFTYTWSHLIAQLSGSPYDIKEIPKLFKRIVTALSNEKYTNWMDNTTLFYVQAFLNNVAVNTFPTVTEQLATGVDYSIETSTTAGEFPRSYLSLLAGNTKILLKLPPHATVRDLNRAQLKGILSYLQATRTLVVPTASSRPPVFYPEGTPAYFNFGTVGALMAKELLSVIGPYPGGTRNPWWTNWTYLAVEKSFDCLLTQQASSTGDSSSNVMIHSLFTWAHSAQVAYDAMTQYLTLSVSEESVLGRHWEDAKKIFFRRFCILSCGAGDERLTSRARCNLPLMNMPEFAATFGCLPDSVMAPRSLCRVP